MSPDPAEPTPDPYNPEDMVLCPPTPSAVGVPQHSLDGIVRMISMVPFGSAMQAMSILAAELFHHRADRRRQAELATIVYPASVASAVLGFMTGGPGRLAFDPRHVSSMQRLLVLHAVDGETRDLRPSEIEALGEALFHLGGALPGGDPRGDGSPTSPEEWADWARYTTLIGAWHHHAGPPEALARAHAWYVDVHHDPVLASHHLRCDVDAWLVEDYNLSFAEQLAGGLGCVAVTEALDPKASIEQRARAIPSGFLHDGALAEKEPALRSLLSATRQELVTMMTGVGNDPARIAWDHTAFEQRPFLRGDDNQMRLISPGALLSWLTRGMHHRALQAAQRRPRRDKPDKNMGLTFLAYSGALGEHAVRRLVAGSHDGQARAGLVRLYDEHEYKVARRTFRSPDMALDFGFDLVLIEVYSGRISRHARTTLDVDALARALDNATSTKLVELAHRMRDLLAGASIYPDLNLGAVRRIWPVLVLAGDPILQTPALWTYLRDTIPDAFIDDARIQRPQIMDLDDLEPLLSLIQEEGKVLPRLLSEIATSPFALLPAKNWVHATFGGVLRRPAYTEDQCEKAFRLALETAYPTSRYHDNGAVHTGDANA